MLYLIGPYIKNFPHGVGVYKRPELVEFDVPVSSNDWTSDNTYTGFSYKTDIYMLGITSDSVVEVIFGFTEAMSGNYAPICETSANTVTIYSKVNTAITIPVIKEI